jgi:ribosome assembly protein YihI (activator of Der GTPase)
MSHVFSKDFIFTDLETAYRVKFLIKECITQARDGLDKNITDHNDTMIDYWLDRIDHFMNELTWINNVIIEMLRSN